MTRDCKLVADIDPTPEITTKASEFGSLLIAQAMSENLQMLTTDRNFPLYNITVA